jgi:hypothetical protein
MTNESPPFDLFEAGWHFKTHIDGHCFDGRDVCRITACDFWPESLKDLHVDAELDLSLSKNDAIVRVKNAVQKRLDTTTQSPRITALVSPEVIEIPKNDPVFHFVAQHYPLTAVHIESIYREVVELVKRREAKPLSGDEFTSPSPSSPTQQS